MRVCANTFCSNEIKRNGRKCSACQSREWRAGNIVQATFLIKKSNARRQGIPFNITLKEFKEWCKKTDYIKFKGQSPQSFTIDRIRTISDDGTIMGYTLSNIQILTAHDNGVKSHDDRREQWAKKRALVDPDCPF